MIELLARSSSSSLIYINLCVLYIERRKGGVVLGSFDMAGDMDTIWAEL